MFPVSKPDAETVNTTKDLQDMGSVATMRVCRVCLAMSVKMYHILEHKLNVMYERVTGVEINTEDKLPKMLCWECVARLSSANNFIEKSLKIQWILVQKLNSSQLVTISDIESINRAHYKLESTLGIKVSKETDSNLYIIKESDEGNDNYNIPNYTYYNESEAESEFNDIGICKEEEQIIFAEVHASEEKDPIKSEYLDVTEEQNVSDEYYKEEDIGDEREAIKYPNTYSVFQTLDIGDEDNKSDIKMAINNMSNVTEVIGVESNITFMPNDTESSKNVFVCDICGEEFYMKSTLIQHIKEHPEMNGCTYCRDDNKSHIICRHSKNTFFICDYCGYKSVFKQRLSLHINTVHEKSLTTHGDAKHTETNVYNCSYCTYKSHKKFNLTTHINAKHTKQNVHSCSFCSYVTFRKRHLSDHVNAKHTKTNVYNCSLCSYKAYNKGTLTRHVNAKHTKTNIYNCDYCSYKVHNKFHLTTHVNAKHTKTNVYQCSLCSYKTYQHASLSAHVNAIHTKTKVYDCSYCSYKAYNKSNLSSHVNAKHTKTKVYNCSYCTFITYQKCSFSAHVNAKHTRTKVYACSYCSHKAYDKSGLTRHVNAKHIKTKV